MVSTITRSGNAVRLRGPGHDVEDDPFSSNSGEDRSSRTPTLVDPVFEGPAFTVTAHDSEVGPDLRGLSTGAIPTPQGLTADHGLVGLVPGEADTSFFREWMFPVDADPTDGGLTALPLDANALPSEVMQSHLASLYGLLKQAATQGPAGVDPTSSMFGLTVDKNREAEVVISTAGEKPGLSNIHSYNQALIDASARLLSYSHSSQQVDPRLIDALRELGHAREEAEEEGFPAPSSAAISNAKRLLRTIHRMWPYHLDVYPTSDGEIAIRAIVRRGSSVLVLCESGGETLCLVNVDGEHRRKRYSHVRELPDEFLREALVEVEHGS